MTYSCLNDVCFSYILLHILVNTLNSVKEFVSAYSIYQGIRMVMVNLTTNIRHEVFPVC